MNLRGFSTQAVCLTFLFATYAADAQSAATTAAVTEYVKAEMQRQHIPGLSLLVVKAGKIIRAEGFGWPTWNCRSGKAREPSSNRDPSENSSRRPQ